MEPTWPPRQELVWLALEALALRNSVEIGRINGHGEAARGIALDDVDGLLLDLDTCLFSQTVERSLMVSARRHAEIRQLPAPQHVRPSAFKLAPFAPGEGIAADA
jgi:hypothetical protein